LKEKLKVLENWAEASLILGETLNFWLVWRNYRYHSCHSYELM